MDDRALTMEERIICAYLYFVRGIKQSDIAAIYPTNSGRVNEAIKAIEKAARDPVGTRKYHEEPKVEKKV